MPNVDSKKHQYKALTSFLLYSRVACKGLQMSLWNDLDVVWPFTNSSWCTKAVAPTRPQVFIKYTMSKLQNKFTLFYNSFLVWTWPQGFYWKERCHTLVLFTASEHWLFGLSSGAFLPSAKPQNLPVDPFKINSRQSIKDFHAYPPGPAV